MNEILQKYSISQRALNITKDGITRQILGIIN